MAIVYVTDPITHDIAFRDPWGLHLGGEGGVSASQAQRMYTIASLAHTHPHSPLHSLRFSWGGGSSSHLRQFEEVLPAVTAGNVGPTFLSAPLLLGAKAPCRESQFMED